jgi:hypothetical protein
LLTVFPSSDLGIGLRSAFLASVVCLSICLCLVAVLFASFGAVHLTSCCSVPIVGLLLSLVTHFRVWTMHFRGFSMHFRVLASIPNDDLRHNVKLPPIPFRAVSDDELDRQRFQEWIRDLVERDGKLRELGNCPLLGKDMVLPKFPSLHGRSAEFAMLALDVDGCPLHDRPAKAAVIAEAYNWLFSFAYSLGIVYRHVRVGYRGHYVYYCYIVPYSLKLLVEQQSARIIALHLVSLRSVKANMPGGLVCLCQRVQSDFLSDVGFDAFRDRV